jgi:sensor histidine kinase YesM
LQIFHLTDAQLERAQNQTDQQVNSFMASSFSPVLRVGWFMLTACVIICLFFYICPPPKVYQIYLSTLMMPFLVFSRHPNCN